MGGARYWLSLCQMSCVCVSAVKFSISLRSSQGAFGCQAVSSFWCLSRHWFPPMTALFVTPSHDPQHAGDSLHVHVLMLQRIDTVSVSGTAKLCNPPAAQRVQVDSPATKHTSRQQTMLTADAATGCVWHLQRPIQGCISALTKKNLPTVAMSAAVVALTSASGAQQYSWDHVRPVAHQLATLVAC
jgi:hypothetical protein